MIPTKIKIKDIPELRNNPERLYEETDQITMAKWALLLANHIMKVTNPDFLNFEEVKQGIFVNEQWQIGNARMYDVRQAGFEIHRLARLQNNELAKNTLRVVGQAVGSGHMKEHALVASDYAVKCINLLFPNQEKAVKKEREWQIETLKQMKSLLK